MLVRVSNFKTKPLIQDDLPDDVFRLEIQDESKSFNFDKLKL